jgi:GNAT superfamily N-acetyltransferase
MSEPANVIIDDAKPEAAPAIANIHLAARQQAMPYLRRVHSDDRVRSYFGRVLGSGRQAWWVARCEGYVVAYMLINGEHLDHLYVSPQWQGHGIGSALLNKAKALSPNHLLLWTFQRNARARSFYEARGFRSIKQTNGQNEEGEPDVQYEWRKAPSEK